MQGKRAQIIRINGPAAGVVLNMPPNVISPSAWSAAFNVRFKNGRVETSPGWDNFTEQQLTGPVKHLAQFFKFSGIDYAIAITNTKVYYYDTGTSTWTDITGTALTGLISDFINSDTAFDLFIFTNNVDRVRKWDSSGNSSNLLGLDTSADESGTATINVSACKSLNSFSGFMHLVNTLENGDRKSQRWRWSRFGTAEGWDNVSTYGQAGFADITDGPDKLQTVRRLGGDFNVLYKERSIHIAQYVGPPTVWSRRLVVNGVGLLAPGAVADIVNEHVFCADDNFYIFNGLAIKPVGTAIFDQFISELDPQYASLMWAHTNYEEHEVIFAYPTVGHTSPNRAVVLNYLTGAWCFRDMPFTAMGPYRRTNSADSWDSDSDSWDSDITRWDDARYQQNAPQHLGGDVDGYVFDYGLNWSQNGASHNSYVISPAIDLKRPDVIKRFIRIYADLIASGSHNLEISYITTDNPNESLVWANSRSLPCDLSTNPWVTMDIAGRYLFLRFRTNGTNNPWKLTGYGLQYVIRSDN